jgi:hypothetical protein
MRRRLKLLLPIMLPNETSLRPSRAAYVLTTNSGAEVPIATTVSPIARLEMLNFFAIEEAPLTRKSAPFISMTKPTMSRMSAKNIGLRLFHIRKILMFSAPENLR